MNILRDKHHALLKRLGTYVQEQRVKVFQEDHEQFSKRLAPFSPGPISSHDVSRMEQGDGSIPLSLWLSAWQLMHVSDKIVDASKADTALFLAASERMNLSEADVRSQTPKK